MTSVLRRIRPVTALSTRRAVRAGVLVVGRHSYGQPTIHVWRDASGRRRGGVVRIGSFTSIADDVHILTGGEHRHDFVTTSPLRGLLHVPVVGDDPHPASKGDVEIGHDVWIGMRTTILSGVRIGNGAVVGAAAVVTRDVEPYAVVAGNPARVAKHRFDPPTVAALERLRWWDWSDDVIRERIDLLLSTDVDVLLRDSD